MTTKMSLNDTVTEKIFFYLGYKCEVVLIRGRHRCGYVSLPKRHIAAKIGNYDDIPSNVHGGLTYSQKDDSKYFIVGFDCAHLNDSLQIWTVEAVEEEVKKLAREMKNLTWRKAINHKLKYMPNWFKLRIRYNGETR